MKDDVDDMALIPDPPLAKELKKSLRTFARWDSDKDSKFPPPVYIRGRKHRRVRQIQEWLRACALEAIDKQPGAVSKPARQAPRKTSWPQKIPPTKRRLPPPTTHLAPAK